MNIFFLDENPIIAANSLCNEHKNRLIYESVQLLCNAYYWTDEFSSIPNIYKKAYYNHPSSKWVRRNTSNFFWLLEHLNQLLKNYYSNGGTSWKRESSLIKIFKTFAPSLPTENLSPSHLAFGATHWKSKVPEVQKVLTAKYNELQLAYKTLQKNSGEEKEGIYIPKSISNGVEAYQTYYCLKQFKPNIEINTFTGEIIGYTSKYPTWAKDKIPYWYKNINPSKYIEN